MIFLSANVNYGTLRQDEKTLILQTGINSTGIANVVSRAYAENVNDNIRRHMNHNFPITPEA
jgi:hypothetical protein